MSQPVDPRDEVAYPIGWEMVIALKGRLKPGISIFCASFSRVLKKNPSALEESTGAGGANSLSEYKPCGFRTKETRHGGASDGRRLP